MGKAKGGAADKKLKKKQAAGEDGESAKSAKSSVRAERKKQKGKKYTLDDDSIKTMRKILADVGCKLHEVEADGNCLFRALGDQLFGDQQQHEEIRKRVVDYIESKRIDFEPFMEDEEKFDHYCKRMREDGTWGGNQELYAAARLFNVYVIVHQESFRMVIECDAQKPKSVLHIAYHGSDHYDSVRSLRDSDLNAPPVEIELDVDGFRPDELAKRWKAHAPDASAAAASQRIASDSGDAAMSVDTIASGVSALSMEPSAAASSGIPTPVVLSKKAQRLLKKSQRPVKSKK